MRANGTRIGSFHGHDGTDRVESVQYPPIAALRSSGREGPRYRRTLPQPTRQRDGHEKFQALERTHCCPLGSDTSKASRMATHGTTTLFAALWKAASQIVSRHIDANVTLFRQSASLSTGEIGYPKKCPPARHFDAYNPQGPFLWR